MKGCCADTHQRNPPARWRRARQFFTWLLPSAGLVLMPKCPMCLAAHIAFWTGLDLSLSVTNGLRYTLLSISGAALLLLLVRSLHHRIFSQCKGNSTCNIQ